MPSRSRAKNRQSPGPVNRKQDRRIHQSSQHESNLVTVNKDTYREHWCMAHELVANVRFWGVERHRVVANVLRREEYAESQTVQEVARRQQTADWAQRETRALFQKVGNVLLLRDVVHGVAAVVLEQRHDVVELIARVALPQVLHARVDGAPGLDLNQIKQQQSEHLHVIQSLHNVSVNTRDLPRPRCTQFEELGLPGGSCRPSWRTSLVAFGRLGPVFKASIHGSAFSSQKQV